MILNENLFEDVLEELQYNNKRDEDEAEEEVFDDSYLFDEEEKKVTVDEELSTEKYIKVIERKIDAQVKMYEKAQKKYRGDSQESKEIEYKISALDQDLKELKENPTSKDSERIKRHLDMDIEALNNFAPDILRDILEEEEDEIEEQLKTETDPEKRREIVSEISDLADEAEKCEDSNNPYGASDAREEIKKLEESDSSSKMFVELDEFKKSWKDLGLTDEDLRKLQNEIITNGDVSIPLGSDVYKIQFSPDSLNKGKSTAFRVIYITIIKKDQIYLVYAFNKSNEANITKNTLSAIRKTANVLNDKEN